MSGVAGPIEQAAKTAYTEWEDLSPATRARIELMARELASRAVGGPFGKVLGIVLILGGIAYAGVTYIGRGGSITWDDAVFSATLIAGGISDLFAKTRGAP